ncbi:hypothetical protein C8R45DRAFT_935244 [Mycena sanguinolenta]|nr:hypothetical protein C8R45DRAFT_935244 [Mycena sanguinolenta]
MSEATVDNWKMLPVVEPGYEIDTGTRDIPTLTDFETLTPVTVVKGHPGRGGGKKVLNRQGRAICRVMAAHGWSSRAIAFIFRTSETTLTRTQAPAIAHDFSDEGPESDLEVHYVSVFDYTIQEIFQLQLGHPDWESSPNGNHQRAAKKRCHTRIQAVAADEYEDEARLPVASVGTSQANAPPLQPQFPHSEESLIPPVSRSSVLILYSAGGREAKVNDFVQAQQQFFFEISSMN